MTLFITGNWNIIGIMDSVCVNLSVAVGCEDLAIVDTSAGVGIIVI
jgi:hypothetical protein